MKVFQERELRQAIEYAMTGEVAIHLHSIVFRHSPQCFIAAVGRGEQICHLFDQDKERLIATAKRLGVKVIKLEREGEPRQHIDLCGAPLRKLLAEAKALVS